MTIAAPTPETRARMVRQRRHGTKLELALRKALWSMGLRYRLHRSVFGDKRRNVDLVFPASRVAVDVRGCFWHACPDHGTLPKSNATWWQQKLNRNVERDADTIERLKAAGWTPIVVWEHEAHEKAASRIATIVEERRRANAYAPFLEPGRLIERKTVVK